MSESGGDANATRRLCAPEQRRHAPSESGVTINEIHRVYDVPPRYSAVGRLAATTGRSEHNARAVINRYLGYWDGNPATLIPLALRGVGAAVRRDDGRRGRRHDAST